MMFISLRMLQDKRDVSVCLLDCREWCRLKMHIPPDVFASKSVSVCALADVDPKACYCQPGVNNINHLAPNRARVGCE